MFRFEFLLGQINFERKTHLHLYAEHFILFLLYVLFSLTFAQFKNPILFAIFVLTKNLLYTLEFKNKPCAVSATDWHLKLLQINAKIVKRFESLVFIISAQMMYYIQ